MSTGYLTNGQCYPTLFEAESAHWSQVAGGVVPSGNTSYLIDYAWDGSQFVAQRYTISNSGAMSLTSTTALPSLSFPTCDPTASFYDGMTLGWGVLAACVAAFGVRAFRWGL